MFPFYTPARTSVQLHEQYSPSAFDCICGRGRTAYNHIGNKRFRLIVAMHVDKYIHAYDKLGKSLIVLSIVDQIRSKNGNFIKYDKATNRWFEIGDELAREKVGQKLREAIFSREALGNTTNQRPSASSNFYEDALQLAKLDCQIVAHSLFGNGASSPESGTGSTWNSNKINVFQPIEQMESNLNIGLEFEMTRTSNNFEGMSKLARLSCTGNMIGGIPCEPQCDDEADSFDELVSELFLEGSSMEYIPIEPLDPNDEIPIEMSSMLSSFLP